jgi:hypothetical protein
MATDPPYSGVIQSGEVAGYTGAGGYTAAAPVYGSSSSNKASAMAGYTGGQGYTGAVPVYGSTSSTNAPVTEKSRRAPAPADTSSTTSQSTPRPGRTDSAADSVVMEYGEAPGQLPPFDYSPPPPPDPLPANEAAAEELETTTADNADRHTAEEALTLAQLAMGLLQAQQRYAAHPEPEPNNALERAMRFLETVGGAQRLGPLSGLPPVIDPQLLPNFHKTFAAYPQDLLGAAADVLRAQAAAVIASTRPTNLGIAYLQGVGLGLFNAAVGIGEGIARTASEVSVIGGLRQAVQVMEQIDERIAQGESPWEAANSVLNPLVRITEQVILANEIAGEALATAPYDWKEAVRLSRQAGEATANASATAVETILPGRQAAAGARRFHPAMRRRTARGTRPPIPATPPGRRPPSPPDSVTGKVYRNGPQRLPSRPLSRPHPAHPAFLIFDRDFLRVLNELEKGVMQHTQAVASGKQEALPSGLRLKEGQGSQRFTNAKTVYNALERRTALSTALAKPDHAYLVQVRIVGVRLANGQVVNINQINKSMGRTKGRIAEHLDMAPDGTYTLAENKRVSTLLESYSKRGGVTGARILPSSALGKQLARETNVFNYAKARSGAKVIVEGEMFDGQTVTADLEPADYRGATPTPYGVIFGH